MSDVASLKKPTLESLAAEMRRLQERLKDMDRLCAALSDGMPIKGACSVAGRGVTTLSEWREKHPRLENRMSEARELAVKKRCKVLQAIS